MSEQNLVRSILRELRARGCLVWRQNSGGMTATYKGRQRFIKFNDCPGCSDVIGMTPTGTFLAIEAKMGRNKATSLQQAFLADVAAHGGIALIVRDSTDGMWDSIVQATSGLTKRGD